MDISMSAIVAQFQTFKRRPLPVGPRPSNNGRRPLGEILLASGALRPDHLARAIALQTRQNLRLGDILLAHDWITEGDLLDALCVQFGTDPIDLETQSPDPRLLDRIGIEACLRQGILPIKRIGGGVVIATCRPDQFDKLCLPDSFGRPIMAICSESALHRAILNLRDRHLIERAETRVPDEMASRYWYKNRPRFILTTALVMLAALGVARPLLTFNLLALWALVSLAFWTALKLATLCTKPQEHDLSPPAGPAQKLPVVSVLVPLFREEDIAQRLVARLGRLNYPKELLDVCLITEEEDADTRDRLIAARLPHWMRVITVPGGSLKTKPRAMNYTLDFCKGSIIGIYDAEDAPDPDQIHKVVRIFNTAPENVACLQGALDFYNTSRNWMSRCFTVEYATWFRVLLPGISQLGLVVPLGGTTLFFRRKPLEEIGAWDAHNVTEDADLGVRLARAGYRTELVDTVTGEEANCRMVPWIKQRSRWVKGFMMTYAVHMRDPMRLWRELGPRRFLGFQILFAGSLSQSLLAPLMWSFWVVPFGIAHPVVTGMSTLQFIAMCALFALCEGLNIATGVIGLKRAGKSADRWWVPTLYAYHPMASFAAYKALYEMVTCPFYWDKTQHGIADDMDHDPHGPDTIPGPAGLRLVH